MTETGTAERAETVRDRYRTVFGAVPAGIEDRITVAETTGRLDAVETIEALRRVLLNENPLGTRTQQLVHFAQLVALGRADPARLHARGALRAGASITDLVGVAETSLVTAGMPAYSLAVAIIAKLISDDARADVRTTLSITDGEASASPAPAPRGTAEAPEQAKRQVGRDDS
jgi:4-carboxymuconolactone decarboxylase